MKAFVLGYRLFLGLVLSSGIISMFDTDFSIVKEIENGYIVPLVLYLFLILLGFSMIISFVKDFIKYLKED